MAYLKMRDGAMLYYEEHGSGVPLIMAHGWKASSAVYQPVICALQDTYHCISYDQRGHQNSGHTTLPTVPDLADDLHEIILTLCPQEKPILLGWSMGGATMLEYIKKYGCDNISKLIIVDISPKMLITDDWPWGRCTRKKLAEDIALMHRDFTSFLREYYSRGKPGYRDLSESAQLARIHERMQGQSEEVLTSLWESLVLLDNRETLHKISVPTAVFHAGIMPSCLPEAAAYYVQNLSGPVKDIFFEDASHAMITEQPERFAHEVRSFIEQST